MTTRNFRVNNGIEIGDVTIDASTNKITGLATSAPSGDGDVVTKAYSDSGTQTMTNKTLTNPIINSPTLNGTITSTQSDLCGHQPKIKKDMKITRQSIMSIK